MSISVELPGGDTREIGADDVEGLRSLLTAADTIGFDAVISFRSARAAKVAKVPRVASHDARALLKHAPKARGPVRRTPIGALRRALKKQGAEFNASAFARRHGISSSAVYFQVAKIRKEKA